MTESFVKEHPLFSHLPQEDLEMVVKMGVCLEKKEGEVIFCERELNRDIFLIQEGRVLITKRIEGKTLELALLQPGDFFGEMELLLPSQGRAAQAEAKSDAKLVLFEGDSFLRCLHQTECGRKMLLFFCKLLTQRLRDMDEAYTKLFLECRGGENLSELKAFREKLSRDWGF